MQYRLSSYLSFKTFRIRVHFWKEIISIRIKILLWSILYLEQIAHKFPVSNNIGRNHVSRVVRRPKVDKSFIGEQKKRKRKSVRHFLGHTVCYCYWKMFVSLWKRCAVASFTITVNPPPVHWQFAPVKIQ